MLGLHVAVPLHIHRHLRPPLSRPPSPPLPDPPPRHHRPPGPSPRPPQPPHVPHLRHHLRRAPPLRRRRNPRNQLVLAAIQDSIPMAPLLPARHAPLGARVLLVLRVLPLTIPAHVPYNTVGAATAEAGVLPGVQPLDRGVHVVPVA
ncbi:hypothetical protein PIB30_036012 [Stylosanthes scabra]|uniref:Uncharacterized protein n=1 Tax=Stylosanthes scabra TaxID=79078 RepID=A0ABU6WE57_9FABA|nr:hypothetical protein [Stylosanthes scabra]